MKGNRKSAGAKRSGGAWVIAVAALVFVLILLLRLMVFVAPHGGRH